LAYGGESFGSEGLMKSIYSCPSNFSKKRMRRGEKRILFRGQRLGGNEGESTIFT